VGPFWADRILLPEISPRAHQYNAAMRFVLLAWACLFAARHARPTTITGRLLLPTRPPLSVCLSVCRTARARLNRVPNGASANCRRRRHSEEERLSHRVSPTRSLTRRRPKKWPKEVRHFFRPHASALGAQKGPSLRARLSPAVSLWQHHHGAHVTPHAAPTRPILARY